MKCYISSIGIKNPEELYNLVGKSSGIRTALITNAIDLKSPEGRKVRYDLLTSELTGLNLEVTDIDLGLYIGNTDGLKKELERFDLIWVAGGNVFYLRQMMRRSGLDRVLKEIINSGVVYGGESAGAAVVGPSLLGFELADDLEKIDEVIYEGVGLVDFVPLPHWGSVEYQSALEAIRKGFLEKGVPMEIMDDNQAVIVDDSSGRLSRKLVGTK